MIIQACITGPEPCGHPDDVRFYITVACAVRWVLPLFSMSSVNLRSVSFFVFKASILCDTRLCSPAVLLGKDYTPHD